MKTDEMIVIFAALVLLAFLFKGLFDLGECHDVGGEYKNGVCMVVLKSNGSVNQLRK
jgi:hypothetical protein